MDANYGLLSLLPVIIVIVTAIITKRAVEPLILGALVGYIILDHQKFIASYLQSLYGELGDSAYYIIIFGLFGIFVKLLDDANAISGFTKLCLRFANNKKKTGVLTWAIGLAMFLDNYFSILSAGISTRKLCDTNRMSREMFAFTVNSIACCTCVIVPISLWGVFMSGQIESALNLKTGIGVSELTHAVPFIFFAWILIIFILLYQLRIIKPFGKMKAAEKRAEETGRLLPEDLDDEAVNTEEKPDTNIWNFLVPMIAVIGLTLFTNELTYGLLAGIALCFIMYIPQKLITLVSSFDSIFRGFEDMFVVTAIVISAFVLQNANDDLGLAPYVVNSVVGVLNAHWLPVMAFLILWILGFVTGSFWGMMAVCFPIMLPLATALDASMYLVIGAVISGAAAGSATCFYGDSITLTCGLAKIRNNDYLQTGLPMMIPPMAATCVAFIAAGFII